MVDDVYGFDTEIAKVDFNLKGRLIQIIGDKLQQASTHFENNPFHCFKKLKIIRVLIEHKLNDDEAKSLKSQEAVLEKSLDIPNKIEKIRVSRGGNIRDDKTVAKLGIDMIQLKKKANLESYFEELMNYLDKYGFLLGQKEDETTSGFI